MDDLTIEQIKRFAQLLKAGYNKYIGMEIGKGHSVPSQSDFAKWLGVSQTSLSNWMNEIRPPNQDNIDTVATRLGPAVYDIFNIPQRMPKDKKARLLMQRWHKLTPAQQAHIEELSSNYEEDNDLQQKKNGGDLELNLES